MAGRDSVNLFADLSDVINASLVCEAFEPGTTIAPFTPFEKRCDKSMFLDF